MWPIIFIAGGIILFKVLTKKSAIQDKTESSREDVHKKIIKNAKLIGRHGEYTSWDTNRDGVADIYFRGDFQISRNAYDIEIERVRALS